MPLSQVFSADGSSLQGTVILLGYTTSFGFSCLSGNMRGAWEALENVEDVDCQSNFGAGSFYNVTFKQWPTMPMENYFIIKATCTLKLADVSGALSSGSCYATFQIS